MQAIHDAYNAIPTELRALIAFEIYSEAMRAVSLYEIKAKKTETSADDIAASLARRVLRIAGFFMRKKSTK